MSRALIFCCLVAACSDGVSSFTMPGEEPLDMTPLRAPCGVDEDLDGDGSLDTFSRFFDEDGGRTWRVEQRDAERTLLHDEVWRFDAGGRLIELSWRVDGELTQHRTFVYDDFGRGLRWERDDDGDGLYEEIEVATAWDEEGGVESTSV